MTRVAVIAVLLSLSTACGATRGERRERERAQCVAQGKVVLVGDPTDQLRDTFVIACVDIDQVDDVYDNYNIEVRP